MITHNISLIRPVIFFTQALILKVDTSKRPYWLRNCYEITDKSKDIWVLLLRYPLYQQAKFTYLFPRFYWPLMGVAMLSTTKNMCWMRVSGESGRGWAYCYHSDVWLKHIFHIALNSVKFLFMSIWISERDGNLTGIRHNLLPLVVF